MEKIGVIGLGYVGLPLAVEFSKVSEVVGYDISYERVEELRKGNDSTCEVSVEELKESKVTYSNCPDDLKMVNYFIVTVPTPVDTAKKPNLRALVEAVAMVAKLLKNDDIVIFESTVYPGCTEEICVPILERESGLVFNKDFYCGYSPERVNPGDKQHRLTSIVKLVSGSSPKALEKVNSLYQKIIKAGTHKTSSIKVAEAAKVIENSQRDLNIAFVNELAIIFGKLGIDTHEILEAAATKWNFIPFKPGLVGGHCIGVDPFYLTYKAEDIGYRPEVILSGRNINDSMPVYVATTVISLMTKNNIPVKGAKILILGITFKENCPDVRNSKVVGLANTLGDNGAQVEIYDPHAEKMVVKNEYGLTLIDSPGACYDVIILAVAHNEFKNLDWPTMRKETTIVYDVKGFLDPSLVTKRL